MNPYAPFWLLLTSFERSNWILNPLLIINIKKNYFYWKFLFCYIISHTKIVVEGLHSSDLTFLGKNQELKVEYKIKIILISQQTMWRAFSSRKFAWFVQELFQEIHRSVYIWWKSFQRPFRVARSESVCLLLHNFIEKFLLLNNKYK